MTPCLHKFADHQCGTNARARLDGCRCDPCLAARRAYDREYARTQGPFPRALPKSVDAQPVREHVEALVAGGMGRKRIAEVSGVPHGSIWKLMDGDPQRGMKPSRRVRRETAEKILATELDVADGAKVPSREAKAIVRELVRRGWSKAELGRRITGPQAKALQAVESPLVMAGTLRTLRGLLAEPVPLRRHPRGGWYDPSKNYKWRVVSPNTPGVPPSETAAMVGELACELCGTAFSVHPMRACWRVA